MVVGEVAERGRREQQTEGRALWVGRTSILECEVREEVNGRTIGRKRNAIGVILINNLQM